MPSPRELARLEVAAPPPMDVPGPAGRALQRYLTIHRRIGPWAAPIALFALPAVGLLLFCFAASVSACGEGCGFVTAVFLVPLIYASFALFVAAVAIVASRRRLRRLRRDLVVTSAMRVQSLKDWFVRGDITEAEYNGLRAKMSSIPDGTAPHLQTEDAAAFHRQAALVLWFTAAPAVALLVISLLALTDGQVVALPFAFVGFLGVVGNATGIFFGIRRGKELASAARRLAAALKQDIDETERELLRAANHRNGGPASSSAEPHRRATFSPFLGR
jgi:uncharacterized membrane protein